MPDPLLTAPAAVNAAAEAILCHAVVPRRFADLAATAALRAVAADPQIRSEWTEAIRNAPCVLFDFPDKGCTFADPQVKTAAWASTSLRYKHPECVVALLLGPDEHGSTGTQST